MKRPATATPPQQTGTDNQTPDAATTGARTTHHARAELSRQHLLAVRNELHAVGVGGWLRLDEQRPGLCVNTHTHTDTQTHRPMTAHTQTTFARDWCRPADPKTHGSGAAPPPRHTAVPLLTPRRRPRQRGRRCADEGLHGAGGPRQDGQGPTAAVQVDSRCRSRCSRAPNRRSKRQTRDSCRQAH